MNLNLQKNFGLLNTDENDTKQKQHKFNSLLGNNNSNQNATLFQNRVNELLGNKKETTDNATLVDKLNPYIDDSGNLKNQYLNYQGLLDNSGTSRQAKQWIKQATGLDEKNKTTTADNSTENSNINTSSNVNGDSFDFSNFDASNVAKMDISSELPKLSTAQIAEIINKHFSNSSVISSSDAEGIKNAQDSTGMSALAILGIGALESGYGTSSISKNTNNMWGYGATNNNPSGNAHRYSQMSEGAGQFAQQFMKDYYNGYGAKSIYSAGSGDNPSGVGYAYYDNGGINSGWVNDVGSIMQNFCKTLASSGIKGTTSSSSSSKGQSLVNEAKKYIGTNYVYGGSSPDGFDCSGLVQYCCSKNGVSVPRTTTEQVKSGVAVDKSNIQPGDLVFFGSSDSPHHVGIYIGNNQYIHSPYTGSSVKISDLSSRSDFSAARRVS